MGKDFDGWNTRKKLVHARRSIRFFYAREIWWCYLGVNVGREQDGGVGFVRPVLILRGFNRETFLGVALTARSKKGKYYFPLGIVGGKQALANLSQIRLIDARRLKNKVCTLDENIFKALKISIKNRILS